MRRLLLIAVLPLAGCYTLQAVHGELELLAARRPLAQVLADPATDPATAARLRVAVEARDAARGALGLPARGSFRSFVRLPRDWPVWNAVVAPELGSEPRPQCFLFVGCIAYRGFFAEADARRYAERARARGDDAFVSPVPAFSTLGWFDDPILWSMLRWDDATLAGFVAHETAHEALYAADDSELDEAYAEVVGDEVVRRLFDWPERRAAYDEWRGERALEARYLDALLAARADLARVYAGAAPLAAKRQAKQQRLAELATTVAALARDAGRPALAAHWTAEPYDNARLALAATYAALQPGLRALLAESDGDLARFTVRVRELVRLAKPARRAALEAAVQRRPNDLRNEG